MAEKEYIVEITTTLVYTAVYEAENEDEAIEMAKEDWEAGDEYVFNCESVGHEDFAAYEN